MNLRTHFHGDSTQHMDTRRLFRPGDFIAILLFLGLSVVATAFGLRQEAGRRAEVIVHGEVVMTLSLAEEGLYRVQGLRGESLLEVKDGHVRMTQSPCPHQFCVRQGEVHLRGEIIVCVPNSVAIRIRGGANGEGVDAVAG
ncbi:hypothetical protein GF324_14015 [bacterium]|nr:hypothetical protein [bacterium]